MIETKEKLSTLASIFSPYPQKLINVKIKEKPALESLYSVQKKIRKAEKLLKKKGRVLVRYSGTQKLVRVMTEGEDEKQITSLAITIADAIKKEIGA